MLRRSRLLASVSAFALIGTLWVASPAAAIESAPTAAVQQTASTVSSPAAAPTARASTASSIALGETTAEPDEPFAPSEEIGMTRTQRLLTLLAIAAVLVAIMVALIISIRRKR